MKYYLIAGEASGDLHGSNLMKGLLRSDSNAQIRFWGGDKMSSVGGTMVRHYKDTAVMGFVEVIKKASSLKRNLTDCKNDILQWRPDVVVLIDYPGFNFRMAKFAHKHGFKVFYYIAPKVWAWKEHRVARLKKWVDKLFIIFPFEQEYFRNKGIEPIYVGNPLLDSISQDPSAQEIPQSFFERNSLPQKPIIALLAGSRKMEINYLMPIFLQFEQLLKGTECEDYLLVLACAPSVEKSLYDSYLSNNSSIVPIYGETYSILRHSHVAIINSGTASLEAALIGTPQIVAYGMNEISYILAKLVIKLEYVSLANIIMKKKIFEELLQHDCTAVNMLYQLRLLADGAPMRNKMMQDYSQLKEVLGGEGASDKVAEEMVRIIATFVK